MRMSDVRVGGVQVGGSAAAYEGYSYPRYYSIKVTDKAERKLYTRQRIGELLPLPKGLLLQLPKWEIRN